MSFVGKYCTWRDQPRFQSHAQVEFRQLLRCLHPQLPSRVFLVGFRTGEPRNRNTICVVPEEFELQPSTFTRVPELAERLFDYGSPHHRFRAHPKVHDSPLQRMEELGWCEAMYQTIDANTGDEWETFISWPIEVEDYHIFTVAQLDRKSSQQYYSLKKTTAPGKAATPFWIYRSLLESVTSLFLNKCWEHLSKPNRSDGFDVTTERDEIIRAAGKRLMDAAAIASGDLDGEHGHFDICNTISTMLYEGCEGTGKILYIARDHPSLDVKILLRCEISLRDHNAVRKLLEISTDELSLLCDSYKIFGIGSLSPAYDPSREDAFMVEFTRRFNWQLRHAGNILMHVAFGMPALQVARFPTATLHDHLLRIFPRMTPLQIRTIVRLAVCTGRQNNGAMMVVASDAEAEAMRLRRQCIPVRPFQLNEAYLPMLTAIDGAVLVDSNAMCHAIGVILDGLSHEKCTAARGARYNSAVRYVYNASGRLAIVKSEDGMIDILPRLMPRISRSVLDGQIENLRAMASQAPGAVDRKNLYETMDWLDQHRFYLSEDRCEEVNALWPSAKEKLETKGWLRQYESFAPDPELDDSYFLGGGVRAVNRARR